MKIDEALLRAYVDAELPPEQCDHIAAVLAHNADMQAQVQALLASRLPYRTAFEYEALPVMPPSLQTQLVSWSAAASSSRSPQPFNRRRWFGVGAGFAASFALGWSLRFPLSSPGLESKDDSPWVGAIANYHALYVRATVDQPADDAARVQRLLGDFTSSAQAVVKVPNLTEVGLSFKRIQRLGYGESPLLQMIFLPAHGKPTALCALPAGLADAPIKQQTLHDMQVVSWRRHGLSYVLVTELPAKQAAAVAVRLVDGGFPAVYGA
jgi:anti-sigma factor RsiW